jgi:hypothetical protein
LLSTGVIVMHVIIPVFLLYPSHTDVTESAERELES